MDLQLLDDIAQKAASGDPKAQLRLAVQCDENGDGGSALDWLRRAASSGYLPARTTLAKRLISRPPFSTQEGVALANEAAREGDGEAAYLMAALVGAGLGIQQSWPSALDCLRYSAEHGYAPAQSTLAMLSRDAALAAHAKQPAPAPDIWRRLRETVDIASWLAVPQPQIYERSPRIATVEGFASPALCDWLIQSARPHLTRAQAVDSATGEPYADGARTNSVANFSIADIDMILLLTRARIATLSGLSTMGMDAPAVLHYAVGQQFAPHFDFLDVSLPGHAAEMAWRGQRALTFLVYLNEGFEGGETDFPSVGRRFKGRKGDAIFFWNVLPDGTPDPLTLHAGCAPTKGEKWLLSQWVRGPINRPAA